MNKNLKLSYFVILSAITLFSACSDPAPAPSNDQKEEEPGNSVVFDIQADDPDLKFEARTIILRDNFELFDERTPSKGSFKDSTKFELETGDEIYLTYELDDFPTDHHFFLTYIYIDGKQVKMQGRNCNAQGPFGIQYTVK